MKEVEDRILRDGRALNQDVLLVDSFLNHRVDPVLMEHAGQDIAEHFKDRGVTIVATIESSGIAPALMAAKYLNVPMLTMKKAASAIQNGSLLSTNVHSFTKNKDYTLTCKPQYLPAGSKVLFVDDFLAMGEAALGAARIIEEAGCTLVGCAIFIEKSFQPGRGILEDKGYEVYSLARVAHMDEGVITFA